VAQAFVASPAWAASIVLARFIKALLFGVQPIDPISLVSACLLLAAVAAAAAAAPAWRAASTDPMLTLRQD